MSNAEIPAFAEALEQFRTFLARQGHPDQFAWVFRDDVVALSASVVLVRAPVPGGADALAASVFEAGRKKGLVELHAVAQVGRGVLATVWFPRERGDEVQGWTVGLKLSIAEPLPCARRIPSLLWAAVKMTPSYRRFQEHARFIGSRAWAAQ